ncbi:MAG: MFS transporter [Pseudomonadota bacterium]
MTKKFTEFRFGWPVVASAALGIGLGLSPLPFYSLGVFAPSLTAEFGWRQDEIMSAFLILTIGVWILSPLVGLITDRYGVRRVVLVSVVLFALSMMAVALNTGSYVVYMAIWVLVAAAGVGTLPITWTRAVNSWFFDRRGLALGISMVGTGMFGFFVVNYSAYMIEQVGWRWAYVALGLLPLVIAFPVAWFALFESTDERVSERANALRATVSTHAENAATSGLTLGMALKDWRLWLLAYAFIPISFAVGGPIPNLVVMLGAKGFDTADAALLASLLGMPGVILGRLIGGYLIDHLWAPGVAAVILSLPALAALGLAQADLSYVIAALSIMLLGFAAGVEYDLMAYLVSRYFGMANYGAIYGLLYGFFAIGAGVGPVVFASSFEATGSYDSILRISAILFVAGALPLLLLGRYRHFDGTKIVDRVAAEG